MIPTPVELGLPEKFEEWRPYQDDAILALGASDKRFVGLVAPTGSGKSLTYMAYALLSGFSRVAILTSTKSLQDQITADFEGMDMRGKANYLCEADGVDPDTTVEDGPCQSGAHCDLKNNGCIYYDKLRAVIKTPVLVTNYSFWLAASFAGIHLGTFDLLVLDEAHAAPDELAGFLSFSMTQVEARSLLRMSLPTADDWWDWVEEARRVAEHEATFLVGRGTPEASRRLRKLNAISGAMTRFRVIGQDHLVCERLPKGMRWDVSNPARYAEKYLFGPAKKVILSSATVREKTLDLLGIDKEDREMLEFPSTFPVDRRPVYVLSGVPRLSHRTAEDGWDRWQEAMDAVIDLRRDRRGIVHTVSFDRAKQVMAASRHSDIMIGHRSGSAELQAAIARYLARKPAILVSPSATTGIDLPGQECEYVIVGKIPFPDLRSRALKARRREDPDYPAYIAAQAMVQSTGRGMRSERDRQESFILDGNWGWFISRYAQFTPRWWRAAIRRVATVPRPPRALGP